MRVRWTLAAGAAGSMLLLASCGGGGEGGTGPGAASAAVSAPAIGATSTPSLGGRPLEPSQTAAGRPSAPRTATLGPLGYGPLRLGMTARQLRGSGLLVGKARAGATGCAGYDLRTHPTPRGTLGVYLSARLGVASIFAVGAMRTPQGIGLGSTLAQVRHAYPALHTSASGASAAVPGNPKAVYTLRFTNGRVTALSLDLTAQHCHT